MKFLLFILSLSSSIALSANYVTIEAKNGKVYHTGLIHQTKEMRGLGKTHVILEGCENLPEEFDLRPLGVVSDVRDQGSCGSCWSFSKTGSLESAILANGGEAKDLSEQELVACDSANYGCGGGNLNDTEYQVSHGQGLEADFPYTSGRTGSNGRCKQIGAAVKAVNFVYAGQANRSPSEQELKCALFKSHTVPWITVSASGSWGSFPSSEGQVYGRCGRGQTNHAVGVVGWKKVSGKTVFIMKNSWGKEWGAAGYGVLPLGCDSFGDEVAYVMTDAMPCKPPFVVLPAVIQSPKGQEIMLGVKAEKGVTYSWLSADKEVGSGNAIFVSPVENTIYKVVAKTACGKAESSVQVQINNIILK